MPETVRSRIVVICGDPGGANAIVPVIKRLRSEKEDVQVFAYLQAIGIMEKNNILFSSIDEKITLPDIQEILQKNHPAILVTGTSFNTIDLEIKFIKVAQKLAIPTLAVLDFWSNYSLRFYDMQEERRYIPDKIAIMDEIAYSEMIAEGFRPDLLIVTGQPAFDALAGFKLNFDTEKRQKIRRDLTIHAHELMVVFVSQPLSKIYGDDESNPRFLGYTEKTVLKNLIAALEIQSHDCKKDITLIIRPHPSEKTDAYEKIASKSIRTIVTKVGNPRDIVMASDLVVGMNTELLVEACYLGCMVVSIQPGLRFKDVLPTNRSGFSIPVYSEEKIVDTIRVMLTSPEIRADMRDKLDHFKQDGHATDRVVNTINQMINAGK